MLLLLTTIIIMLYTRLYCHIRSTYTSCWGKGIAGSCRVYGGWFRCLPVQLFDSLHCFTRQASRMSLPQLQRLAGPRFSGHENGQSIATAQGGN